MISVTFFNIKKRQVKIDLKEVQDKLKPLSKDDIKYVSDKADALFTDEPPTPRNRK
jgi:hypothetical protein